jgi:hypothetical protein
MYTLVTKDNLQFNANIFNYFFKKFTYNLVGTYDTLIKFQKEDIVFLVKELLKKTHPSHLIVLRENVFNPVNSVWGFSALCALYGMYVKLNEGKNTNA